MPARHSQEDTLGERVEIRRDDLHTTRLARDPHADRSLDAGQARLRIGRFALSANNVTYAAFGSAMKYWQFFPVEAPDWGCVPVWGYADVTESACDGLTVGERLYGYLPMGSHLIVQPARIGRSGFSDGTEHRAALPAVYNRYERVQAAPDAEEGVRALLRPLFTTSFLIDDFLAENGFFGASQLLLSSASSKTAWGTAICLAHRAPARRPRIVGLTSDPHVETMALLGCFDEIRPYRSLEQLDSGTPSVYVDFCGDAGLRRRIHEHWHEHLGHSAAVGGTHWTELGTGAGLPGPRPTLFFAPSQAAARAAAPPAGWGADGLQDRVESAWATMLAHAHGPSNPWLQLDEVSGLAACREAWQRQLAGEVPARVGMVVRL